MELTEFGRTCSYRPSAILPYFQHVNTADITKIDNEFCQANQGFDPSLTCINMPVALACV
jgi:hypothetical protein